MAITIGYLVKYNDVHGRGGRFRIIIKKTTLFNCTIMCIYEERDK